jgi:hypothetical protein
LPLNLVPLAATGLNAPGNVVNVGVSDASAGFVNLSEAVYSSCTGPAVAALYQSAPSQSFAWLTFTSPHAFQTATQGASPIAVQANNAPAGAYLITCYFQSNLPSVSYDVGGTSNANGAWASTPSSGTINLNSSSQNINIEYTQTTGTNIEVILSAPNVPGQMYFYSCDFWRLS